MKNFIKTVGAFITKPRKVCKKNKISGSKTIFIKSKVVFYGINNICNYGENNKYCNSRISFTGNNNTLIVGSKVRFNNVRIVFEGDNNVVEIGDNTVFVGETLIAAGYNTKISIGKNCLFSTPVTIRSFDSHHIISNNEIINPAKDIFIGDHCWVCQNVIVLKGAKILDNTVVGSGTIVNKAFDETGVLLVGAPAHIKKHNINWKR